MEQLSLFKKDHVFKFVDIAQRQQIADKLKRKIPEIPKRIPASKSGRLLVSTLQRLIFFASIEEQTDGAAKESTLRSIDQLVRRIQKRLTNETKKNFPQCEAFREFNVTFIKPKHKRASSEVISATSRVAANALIKRTYGKATKIIRQR